MAKVKDEGKDATIEQFSAEITTLKKQIDALTAERQDLRLKIGVDELIIKKLKEEVQKYEHTNSRLRDQLPTLERALKSAIGDYQTGSWNTRTREALLTALDGLRATGLVK